MAGVKVTWLGHATLLLESPEGKTVLIDPWLNDNPSCPDEWKSIDRFAGLDMLLVTHGHFDHVGDLVAIAKAHEPTIVCIPEIAAWLEGKGVGNISAMNKGGTQSVAGLDITMVDARHSGGIMDGNQIIYGGEPAGFVIHFENERTLYVAGDTCVFLDMQLIGELYSPEAACLPIGDHFTMGPREAAKAVELLNVGTVIPVHYGTFPLLTGTPEQLQELLGGDSYVVTMDPGGSVDV